MKKHEAVKPLVSKSMPLDGYWEDLYFVFGVFFFLWVCCMFCLVLGEEGEKLL